MLVASIGRENVIVARVLVETPVVPDAGVQATAVGAVSFAASVASIPQPAEAAAAGMGAPIDTAPATSKAAAAT
jgi:hypothetical protein